MKASRERLLDQENARAVVYRQLADAFRVPSEALFEGLKEMAAALELLDSEAWGDAARLAAGRYDDPDDRLEIKIDHAALFMGPFLAPAAPYGSVYLEDQRRLMGASTVDARRHYLSLGLDLSPDFKEAPDHICAELEFMHVLVHRAIGAVETLDRELLAKSVRQQSIFLVKHLGTWAPAFAHQILQHAQTGYYRNLAAVLETFVAEEMEALPDLKNLQPAPRSAAG